MVPYGVPPLNGFPINVPRNTAYGFSDDYTEQDVIALNSTIDHKFDDDLNLRNQTEFVWVNTAVRETSGGFVGTLAANGGFVQAANGPGDTPYSAAPLNQLYIRQLSRDRNINDYTLENQSELTAKFDTAAIGHTLLMGIDLNYEAYTNKASSRTGTCNGIPLVAGSVGCTPAGFTVGAGTPGNVPSVPGNYASSQAWGFGMYANDTIQAMPWLKLVGGVRWDAYSAQIGNSINSVNTAGNTTAAYLSQTDYFTSVRTGAIVEPNRAQSYYFSYSTSFNPSLEQLTSTTGTQQLPPESNEGFEAGAKYELLNGNLSLNGALFQITKMNARTANADGTFSPTGTVRVQGARVGFAGQIMPNWQVFGGYAYLERPHHQRHHQLQRRRQYHGQRAAQHTEGLGQPLDHLHDQGYLRDRRRCLLRGPALRQQPEYGAGAGVHALRPDSGLQAADLRDSRQHLQPVQHDVLRRAHGVGRWSRGPGRGYDGLDHAHLPHVTEGAARSCSSASPMCSTPGSSSACASGWTAPIRGWMGASRPATRARR